MLPQDEAADRGRGPGTLRLVVSFVLGALLWGVARTTGAGWTPWPLLAVIAGVTVLAARSGPSPTRLLVLAHALVDITAVSVLVGATGGAASPLVLLFVVTILLGGAQGGARGALASSAAAAVAFGAVAIIVGEYGRPLGAGDLWYLTGVHGGAFLLLGVLTGTLSERGRRSSHEAQATARELRRVRLTTDKILEHMPIGIVTASADGCVVRANQAARDLLGLKPMDPLVGQDLGTILEAIAPSLLSAMEAVLLTGKWAVREEIVMRRGSQEHPIGVSFAPFVNEDDDTLEGLIVTFSDLRHVRRMEDEMRRSGQLASLGELAAGVAHEVRNPLASISGAVQMLRADQDRDADERELMELIVSESERLNRIIAGVLDYTQDHSTSRRIHDVSQTAREVIRLVRHDAALTVGRTIVVDFAPDQDFRAEVEENGLKQVFLNLIRNALQAMSVGGILRVTGEVHDGRIYLVFRDTGHGIQPQELEDIFRPFHTSKAGGTGLGLSIASRIVEGNGGTIQVKSTPGIGTAFTVELPSAARNGGSKPGRDRPMTREESPQPAEAHGHGRRTNPDR